MFALIKALLLIARYYRRIALSLEHMERLKVLELRANGIYETDPAVSDEVEVSYGVKVTDPDNPHPDDMSR
jgi:hypothetical protein